MEGLANASSNISWMWFASVGHRAECGVTSSASCLKSLVAWTQHTKEMRGNHKYHLQGKSNLNKSSGGLRCRRREHLLTLDVSPGS